MTDIEERAARNGPLPELPADIPEIVAQKASFGELFQGIYLKRTLTAWTMCFATAFVGYGLLTWLPSIFRNIFKLPNDQILQYNLTFATMGFLGGVAGLLLIDKLGRKICFTIAFSGGGLEIGRAHV